MNPWKVAWKRIWRFDENPETSRLEPEAQLKVWIGLAVVIVFFLIGAGWGGMANHSKWYEAGWDAGFINATEMHRLEVTK